MTYSDQDIDLENLDRLVKDYLEKGGTVTECEKYARTPADKIESMYGWGKKKKKTS